MIYKLATLDELIAQVDFALPVYCDTETCGLYGKVRLFQAKQSHWSHTLLVEWPDAFSLAVLIKKADTRWVNAHYDFTTIGNQNGVALVPDRFEDLFLAYKLIGYSLESHSLDSILEDVLGYCPYTKAGLDKKSLQKSNWDTKVLSEQQKLYAAIDVHYLDQVDARCNYELMSYRLDKLTLGYCLKFQVNGMPLSVEACEERMVLNNKRIEELAVPINVNSYQQVRAYLNCTESDDLALARMSLAGNEKAKNVREVRKLTKQNSFLTKYIKTDGLVLGKFKPTAKSGRLTSDDENLQQIPRKLKVVFQAPDGEVFIYADYAQLELRSICAITACKAMEKLFRENKDLHGFTTDLIYLSKEQIAEQNPELTEEQVKLVYKNYRTKAKMYNFLLLYGGGISMLISSFIQQADIMLTEQEANNDRRRWRKLWPEIFAWQERGTNAWRAGKPGSTPLGRMYTARMLTDQLNIENQGAGADVTKLALHYFYPKLMEYNREHGIVAKLRNVIHDSFIVTCPDDEEHYKAISVLLAESMQKAWFEMSKLFKIKDLPMPVDVGVGYNWGTIENEEYIYNYVLEGMTYANCA